MSEFAGHLRHWIDQQIQKKLEELATGSQPDFAGYRAQCSHIRCLREIREEINTILRDMADLPLKDNY